ncbi:terpene synthase family protein [Streptomyces sp. NPDC048290]|uniref:terpene synthase family protein n=1 Tax=Streptomyces sp. NPDC048290 TaxID=3155811 RepID=UPI00341C0E4F
MGRALPERLAHHPRLRTLYDLARKHIGWVNDVFSANRERSTGGQKYNLVPVMERPAAPAPWPTAVRATSTASSGPCRRSGPNWS